MILSATFNRLMSLRVSSRSSSLRINSRQGQALSSVFFYSVIGFQDFINLSMQIDLDSFLGNR